MKNEEYGWVNEMARAYCPGHPIPKGPGDHFFPSISKGTELIKDLRPWGKFLMRKKLTMDKIYYNIPKILSQKGVTK